MLYVRLYECCLFSQLYKDPRGGSQIIVYVKGCVTHHMTCPHFDDNVMQSTEILYRQLHRYWDIIIFFYSVALLFSFSIVPI